MVSESCIFETRVQENIVLSARKDQEGLQVPAPPGAGLRRHSTQGPPSHHFHQQVCSQVLESHNTVQAKMSLSKQEKTAL